MPPKRKSNAGVLRCAYVEGRKRCARPGVGNPPLCEAHRIVLEEESTRQTRPGERHVGLLGRGFRGQRISDQHKSGGLRDIAGMFHQHPNFDELRTRAQERVQEQARRFQQGARQTQQARPRKPPGPDPRTVLGFMPGQKLTPDDIKKRHRELARKHHPDRGGSVARMQEINAAVDQLLASM